MTESNLTFAKIVPNPTPFGWSQVYSAGKLFAAISLEKHDEAQEKDYLNVLGKEILNTLEQEFFTLENKDLESIRQSVVATSEKISKDIVLSFVIGSIVNNILYLYILGDGKVDIKRAGALGTLLEAKDQPNDALKEASGYLQEEDVIILQTRAFCETISESTLSEFLDNPSIAEAAENLAPLVHEKESPIASAIIVQYKEGVKSEVLETQEDSKEPVTLENDDKVKEASNYYPDDSLPKKGFKLSVPNFANFKKLSFGGFSNFNSSKKLILSIVVIVVVVFVLSVVFALKKQNSEKVQAQFQAIFPSAQKKYEEGNSLVDLNQALASDSFKEAKSILESGKNKFPTDSSEKKQIDDLLVKVNLALGTSAKSETANASLVNASESFYLSQEIKNSTANYFAQDDKNVYFVTNSAVSKIAKSTGTTTSIIKNNNDWKTVGGISTYNGNVYLLDKDQNQILKFVAGDGAFSKADYFPASITPKFANASSITIDNSIYVLFSDSQIAKYLRGQAQDFALKGLDKPLSNPTRIYSNPDFTNIYILDNGNSRILVFDKTGSFKAQYKSAIIKNAKDFEVLETDKKIYVLSGGKIYKINL